LKTLEKINRKAIRKSLEKENQFQSKPAHLAQPAHAPPVPDRRAPPVSANLSALTFPSLSLSLLGGTDLSALFSSRAPAPSLSVPPSPPVSSSSTSRPRSPRRGRTQVHVFFGHVCAPAPLLSPAPYSPTSPLSFTPPAKSSRPLSRSTHACRELRHRSLSTAACSVATVASAPRPVPR
jgi:hypothetical protein